MEPNPLLDLHTAMIQHDLLNPDNHDFAVFSASLEQPGASKKLYNVLKSEGWADMPLDEFESRFLPKKKVGGESGLPDFTEPSSSPASARIAEEQSEPPFNIAPVDPEPFIPEMEPSEKKDPLSQLITPVSESTRTERILPGLYTPTDFTGEEDAMVAGKDILRKSAPDYDEKEKALTPLKKGAHDLQAIDSFAIAADKQARHAGSQLEQKYGEEWSKNLITWAERLNTDNGLLSPAEKNELATQYNAIVNDPEYARYSGAIGAKQKASVDFNAYGAKNPEYAVKLARQKERQLQQDMSAVDRFDSWGNRKLAGIWAGIASLPRTVVSAIAPENDDSPLKRATDALGGWADRLVEETEIENPVPSGLSRPIWEKMAPFKGMDVALNEDGSIKTAYKDGKVVALSEKDQKEFVESNAGAAAEERYTGTENVAYKLADTVSDLFLMRYFGGGTKVGTSIAAFTLQHKQAYDAAIQDLNMSATDAAEYALVSTGINAAIESYVGGIETNAVKVAAARQIGISEAKALVGKASVGTIAKAAMKPVIKEIAGENAEEVLQMISEKTVAAAFNAEHGSSLDDDFSGKDLAETILLTTLATGIAGGGDAMRNGVNDYTRSSFIAAVENPAAFAKAIDIAQQSGAITEDQSLEAIDRIGKMNAIYSNLPADMSQEAKAEATVLEWQKMATDIQLGDSPSTAQQKIAKEEGKAIDEQIISLIKPDEAVIEPVEEIVADPVQEEIIEVLPSEASSQEEIVVAPVNEPVTEEVFDPVVTATPMEDVIGMSRVDVKRDGVPSLEDVAPDSRATVGDVFSSFGTAKDALIDDMTNVGIKLMPKSYEPGASDISSFRDFVEEMVNDAAFVEKNKGESFQLTAQRLAEEYAMEELSGRSGKDKSLRQNFDPQTMDDFIADEFLFGTRLMAEQVQADLPAEMSDSPGTRLAYTNSKGIGIDQMAEEINNRMNGDEASSDNVKEISDQIREFIRANPTGPGAYIRMSMERAVGAQLEGATEQEVSAISASAVSHIDEMSNKDKESMQAAIDPYVSDGVFDSEKFIEDFDSWDPFDNPIPHFQQLTPKALQALKDERPSSATSANNDETPQKDPKTVSEAENSSRARTPDGSSQTQEITPAENVEDIDRQLKTIELPESLEKEHLVALRREGAITIEDAVLAQEFIQGVENDETKAAYQKAMDAREALRSVQKDVVLVEVGDNRLLRPEVVKLEDGRIVVTGGSMYVHLFEQAGGVFDPVSDTWEFPAENEGKLMLALSQQRSDGADHIADVGNMVGESDTASILTKPGAIFRRYRTRAKLKAANSFRDRLNIAASQYGFSDINRDKELQKALRRMKEAFPNIDIVTNIKEIESAKEEMGIKGLVLGFQHQGKVYIDPRVARSETAIHEFGHIWETWAKENEPTLHAKGMALIEGSDYLADVSNNPAYSGLTEEEKKAEALALAIGERGALFLNNSTAQRFKSWLSELWDAVGRAFGFRVQPMTLQKFVDTQAKRMLSGKVMDETSERIAELEQSPRFSRLSETQQAAIEMRNAGESDARIFAATGWYQNAGGDWKYSPLDQVYMRQEPLTDPTLGKVADMVDAPGLFAEFPEVKEMTIEFEDRQDVVFEDGKIIAPLYARSEDVIHGLRDAALSFANRSGSATVEPMADEENAVVNGIDPGFNPAVADSEYRARLFTAQDIIREELKRDGMRGMDAKVAEMAKVLSLSEQVVQRLVEQEAFDAGLGTLMIDKEALGSKETVDKTKKWVERQKENFVRWGTKNWTVTQGLPRDIYEADQRRLGLVAEMLKRGQYRMKDLDRAMKAHYKSDLNDTHWTIVDNVLRGKGDWEVLPPGIKEAAMGMRELMDSVSRQLVMSGAVKGKMIVTVLKNSGVPQDVLDASIPVVKALEKLPFERTEIEQQAIEQFLLKNGGELGNYFYRSYRVHDDKDWKDKVSPRVMAEARAWIESDLQNQIKEAQDRRDEKIEKVDDKIQSQKESLEELVAIFEDKVTDAKERLTELKSRQDEAIEKTGRLNKTIERSFVATQKKLREFKQKASEAKALSIEDIDVLNEMVDAGLNKMFVVGKKIVGVRREIAALEAKKERISEKTEEKVLEPLYNAAQNIEGIIKDILDVDKSPVTQLSRGMLGSKDNKIFKGREEIAEPIRELMGEYHDPRINFVKSMYRAVNNLANQRFLTEMRANFTGKYFFEQQNNDAYKQISSEGSAALAPMNGMWTTPEIKEVFDEYYKRNDTQDWFWKAITKASSAVKYGKTILSPVTHFRNFFGNTWFVVNNAYDLKKGLGAFVAFTDSWDKKLPAEKEEYLLNLTKLRVLGNGAHIGSVNELLNTMNSDRVDKFFEDYLGNAVDSARKKIQETYSAEDDFFRIMAFETEKARYSRAWYGDDFNNLSPAEQDSISNRAADLVTALLPTYSKIPQAVRWVQRFPLAGTFVAFPAEMFRVTANQLKITRQELADPRTRHIGMRRVLGMGIAQGALSVGLTAIGKWLAGVSDDEDDAARSFLYEWQKDATLVWSEFSGNEIAFVNLSYTDPYAFLKRPITRMLTDNEDTFLESLGESAFSMISPFVSAELTTGTLAQLYFNKDTRTEQEIYNRRLGILGDYETTWDFMLWNLQPGIVKFGVDLTKAITNEPTGNKPPKEVDEVLLGLVGLQTERRNKEQMVTAAFRGLQQQKNFAREIFTDKQWNADDKYEKDALYLTAKREYNEVLTQVGFSVERALTIGVPMAKIQETLKEKGFSELEVYAALNKKELAPVFKDYNK